MKTKILSFIIILCAVVPTLAQHQRSQKPNEAIKKRYTQMMEQERKEGEKFYANADSAQYGIRYRWTYLYDKERNQTYKEDRIVLVTADKTLDMSYQSIGERKLWEKMATTGIMTHDSTLAYRLTPSFYFYYPQSKQLKRTYRIITEEFLLSDAVINNQWELTNEEKNIDKYRCKKAVCILNGRTWIAWYTNDLPHVAAPRHLVGLPGVVLEAYDESGDIKWTYTGCIPNDSHNKLYIKFPDKLSEIPVDKFPIILRLYSTALQDYIKGSRVNEKSQNALPEKLQPSTGIDAYRITNPIDLEE